MKNLYFFIILLGISTNVCSGELINGAYLAEVADNYSNDAAFAVKIEGGVGVCTNGNGWIAFPEAKASSTSSHNQAFSIALAALSANKKVRIHNYEDDSCAGANFISISK